MIDPTPHSRLTLRRLMIATAILAVFLAAALRMPFALWPLTVLAIAALWVSSEAQRRKVWGRSHDGGGDGG